MARAIVITGGNLDNVKARLRQAQQMINERHHNIFIHNSTSTEDDVEENVAEDYNH